MSETVSLPVLPLDDAVVLPGMVVPIRFGDGDARAAVEAAQAVSSDNPRVLLVPRPDGKYGPVGAIGVVEQVGRFPGGGRGAVIRATHRAKIGSGTTGPGAALWVEATVLVEPEPDERTEELAREYRAVVSTVLQQRGAWQVIDSLRQIDDPSALADLAAGAPYLTSEQKQCC